MRLILSDIDLKYDALQLKDTNFIDLSSLQIKNCMGCFGCWTKTPGKCVIRDDAVKVYPLIAACEQLVYITHVVYGGYDAIMKRMLERTIPIQQAFLRVLDGETHHVQRKVALKDALIIAYGADSSQERAVFEKLIARNAKNMNFKQYRIRFCEEAALEETLRKELDAWNNRS
ncbi:NAD(P)H-dependent oxidoreductase [Massilicoli timonensis]|mgnify:FL=1|uniref:NAD(P)H-dependent oxidoreductase n=1 Tax=Massilicoli timonensis TaxID=2015901 RepID=UPI00248AD1E4|nr:NAD(P)H-dependent oxidoreductase [Massilicoli timonensis]